MVNKSNKNSKPQLKQQAASQTYVNGIATWSTNSYCTYNGQVLSIHNGSLSFDGIELLQNQLHFSIEKGFIYGLVGRNGSGKTSLVRALYQLNGFPTSENGFSFEYLSADIDTSFSDTSTSNCDDENNISNESNNDNDIITTISTKEYCLQRVQRRVRQIEIEIDRLELELENTSNEEIIEDISNKLSELYDLKDDLVLSAENQLLHMFEELNFGEYTNYCFYQLSSGWKYKCQLLSALLTKPNFLIIDEPSFLDANATKWLVGRIKDMTKSTSTSFKAMCILISHKEALMEEVCDRIIYINPTSKTLNVYNCSFIEFQNAHIDRVQHAKKEKEQCDKDHTKAKVSLQNLKKQLKSKEHNLKATTTQHADQRFIKGKNKEAKQKADHSAASKVKRLQKKAQEMEEQEEQLRETKISPLELEGADNSNNDQPIVEMLDICFKYEGSDGCLLKDLCLQVAGNDKILVKGANGQGKSTLAKIIIGALEPTQGEIRRQGGRIAYFHQDALFELIHVYGNEAPIDFIMTRDPENISILTARSHLGRFGLKGNICIRKIKTLSAGQRVRLWLAREFWPGEAMPMFLLVDEVTENLDKDTTDTLISSFTKFQSAILAISHDEYFCECFPATQKWMIHDKRLFRMFQ